MNTETSTNKHSNFHKLFFLFSILFYCFFITSTFAPPTSVVVSRVYAGGALESYSGFGDIVFGIKTIETLKKAYPNSNISLVVG